MKVWSASVIAPEALTVALTLWRLDYRRRTRGLWWDDYFALISLIIALPFYSMNLLILIASEWTHKLQIIMAWTILFTFMSLLWTTRISVALSVARIMPPQHFVFRATVVLAFVFALLAISVDLEYGIICARDLSWQQRPPYVCAATAVRAIFPMTSDVLCDILIVALPLREFWNVKLKRGARRLILTGFAGSTSVAVVTLTCGILGLVSFGNTPSGVVIRVMIMHVVAVICMAVCNALVAMTYFYQIRNKHDKELQTELSTLTETPTVSLGFNRTHFSRGDSSFLKRLSKGASPDTAPAAPATLTDVSMNWSLNFDSRILAEDLKTKRSSSEVHIDTNKSNNL